MRTLVAASWTLVFAFAIHGQEPPKKEASLKVGDPAPAIKADRWLQGKPVKEFAQGNVYVVEFWATWCGPCIVMMPHMAEMQAEFRDRGVTFIGFSKQDPNNTAEKVEAFVTKRGPKLGYTFAFSAGAETYDAWMRAANRNGIPCCFVVDKKGKIAYIGHPMYLDLVMPAVVGGTWSEADVKKLDDVEKDVNAMFKGINNPDAEAGLKAVDDFNKKYPLLANIPYFIGPKISLLLKANRLDDAKKMAKDVASKAVKQDDPTALRAVSAAMRSPGAAGNKELLQISVYTAEMMLKMTGDKDLGAVLNIADAYFASGDRAKAREFGAKAVAAADNPRTKEAVEKMIKKYDDEKKDNK
jgi:thiol-disulfide isomerase/thioredoxin